MGKSANGQTDNTERSYNNEQAVSDQTGNLIAVFVNTEQQDQLATAERQEDSGGERIVASLNPE